MGEPAGSALGAVLRQLRVTRGMTLVGVARQVPCSFSLVASVERGTRTVSAWLAQRLDALYGTGHAISALTGGGKVAGSEGGPFDDVADVADIIVVHLPEGGVSVPLSRRKLLAAFGIGTVGGPLLRTLDHGLGGTRPTAETISELRKTYDGFLVASRFSTSPELKDAIIGRIAVVDALRHRAPTVEMRRDLTMLMARHAEALSWLHEESFDVQQALYWLDRTGFWAQTIDWSDMVGFTSYRRAMLAMNCAEDKAQTVELAKHALRQSTLPNVKGTAASVLSQGYAMMPKPEASARAMDQAIEYLSRRVDHPNNPVLDQQSVMTDDVEALYRSAPQLQLGITDGPIAVLGPRVATMSRSHPRIHNIISARLALAFASAGAPERGCLIAANTLDALDMLPSQLTWRWLQRTSTILSARWPNRSDVKDIIARIKSKA